MPSRIPWGVACALLLSTAASASEPLFYEGRITDGSGAAIDAEAIAFAVYDGDGDDDAQPVWRSAEQRLAVDLDGRFIAVIEVGEVGPLDAVHLRGPRWLEVIVDGIPLAPRQRIGAVPRAIFGELGQEPVAEQVRGLSPRHPAASCSDALASGVERSGVVWVVPPLPERDPPLDGVGEPREVYCDQVTLGGGWALIYNSVLGVDTTQFWRIPYAERLGRFGRASLDSNYYDGLLYLAGHGDEQANEYIDVVEDLRGKDAVMLHASAEGFVDRVMLFDQPTQLGGLDSIYRRHFASGWSSHDADHDTADGNCAEIYSGVTQHYDRCFRMNVGSDAGNDPADGYVGPHLYRADTHALDLATDGTDFSRVRRISRFVRW